MSQGPVRYVEPNFLLTEDDKLRYSSARRQRDMIPVIPLTALREELEAIVGQAHGGAMLGGDDAYRACLQIEVSARRLLASLREVGK